MSKPQQPSQPKPAKRPTKPSKPSAGGKTPAQTQGATGTWLAVAIAMAACAALYFGSRLESPSAAVETGDEASATTVIAKSTEVYNDPVHIDVPCGQYDPVVPGCTPTKCGRVFVDGLFSEDTLEKMRALAEKSMMFGGGSGGPTIMDLHTGAVSRGDRFVNIYQAAAQKGIAPFSDEDIQTYTLVKDTIKSAIETEFAVAGLRLTKPTFFSRITDKPPKSANDIYWMPHVDRETYGSFVYTSLLYLNTYGEDYQGGEFVFLDDQGKTKNIVQPRAGRVSFFTSGDENEHHVSKVTQGVRYAVTVSFTCNEADAIADPMLHAASAPESESA